MKKFKPNYKILIALACGIVVALGLFLVIFIIDFSASMKKLQSPYGQIDFEKVFRGKNAVKIALATCYSRLIYAVFHEAVSPKVLMGQDDWLFYAGESTIEDMLATSPCPDNLKKAWAHGLRQRADWLASRGIVYRVVMVPDKHTVYPEFLPERIRARLAISRFQQIKDFMGDTPCLVDLRPALLSAKAQNKGRLYIHTDSHWTNLGAYKGYRHIMLSLGEAYRECIVDMPDHEAITGGAVTRDLARFNGLDSVEGDVYYPAIFGPEFSFRRGQVLLPEGYATANFPLGVFSTFNAKMEKSVVVFRDSFASSMEPFLSSSFRRATFYWTMPSDDLFYKVIELERPDVVIEERAERYFKDAPEAALDKILEKASALRDDAQHALGYDKIVFMNAFLRGQLTITREDRRPRMLVDNVQVAEISDGPPIEGAVESAKQANGMISIAGWAGSAGQGRSVDGILAVKDDTVIYVTAVNNARADTAASQNAELGPPRFVMSFPSTFVPPGDGAIELYALMGQSARRIKRLEARDIVQQSAMTVEKP